MRLALVTDAWLPQVNGVVRTLGNTIREIEAAIRQNAGVIADSILKGAPEDDAEGTPPDAE